MDLTQEFFDFIGQQNVFNIKFMDDAGVQTSAGKCFYGYSPVGEVAVNVGKHLTGINHTGNLLIGLDGTRFSTITEGASNTYTYINFFMKQ